MSVPTFSSLSALMGAYRVPSEAGKAAHLSARIGLGALTRDLAGARAEAVREGADPSRWFLPPWRISWPPSVRFSRSLRRPPRRRRMP